MTLGSTSNVFGSFFCIIIRCSQQESGNRWMFSANASPPFPFCFIFLDPAFVFVSYLHDPHSFAGYSRRKAKSTFGKTRRSGREWRKGSNDDDDMSIDDRGQGLGSGLTGPREGFDERRSSRRGHGGGSGLGESPLESLSRSRAIGRQRYDDPWEQGRSDS